VFYAFWEKNSRKTAQKSGFSLKKVLYGNAYFLLRQIKKGRKLQ